MPEANKQHTAHELTPLDVVILILSVYVLVAIMVDTFFKLPIQVSRLLVLIDDLICIIFLYDFFKRLYLAKNRARFMRWGWIDFVSSIPAFEFLLAGRAIRVIRLLRILRAFRSIRHLITHIFKRKTQGALATAATVAILMVIFSSISILQVEHAPNSNIKTAEDALWWAYVTITSVGYGDRYPVTTEGRIIAALLMTVGVGLFGTYTAFLASWFVGIRKKDDKMTPE